MQFSAPDSSNTGATSDIFMSFSGCIAVKAGEAVITKAGYRDGKRGLVSSSFETTDGSYSESEHQ
jgi:hypothetical protein